MRIAYLTPQQMVEPLAQGLELTCVDVAKTGLDDEQIVKVFWTSQFDQQPPLVAPPAPLVGRYVAKTAAGHVLHGPGPYRVEIR